MLTQNVIRIAAKCNTNAKCNNIDAKCNKIFNAECNNLSTQIVITFLTHNVITQNVIISEQRRACYQISNPNQITYTPFPRSGQKWSALKRRNWTLFMDPPVQDLVRLRCWANSRFRLASNVFPDIESVGRIEKKKPKKQNHKKSRNRRPWYPRTTLKVNIHIFGLTKCTIYCKKCSCLCSCFSLCCYCAHFPLHFSD